MVQWHTVQRRRTGPAGRPLQQGQGGQQRQQHQGGRGQHQQRYSSPNNQGLGGQKQQGHGARQQGHDIQQQQGHGGTGQQQRPGLQEQRWIRGASRDVSTPWCRHVHNCLQGRFCVLRKEGEEDFSSQPRLGKQ